MKKTLFVVATLLTFTVGSTVAFAGDMGNGMGNMDSQSMPNMPSSSTTPTPNQSSSPSTTTPTATTAITQRTTRNVIIQNFAFVPASITVPMGTTVTWTNRDNTAHTVTGDTSGGPMSGQLQPGQSYSFTFNQSGTFPYHCTIHPMMMGTVTVTSATPSTPTPPNMPTTPTTPPATNGSSGTSNANTNTNTNTNTTNVNVDGQTSQASTTPTETTTPTTSTPAVSTAASQTPSQLPDTGAGNVLAVFIAAVAAGAGLSSLYLRRKLSRS